MKRLFFIAAIALTIAILQGCGSNNQNDSKEIADSTNEARTDQDLSDSTKTNAGAAVVAEQDSKFAVAAADGGMAEVELGNLAQQKAVDAKVKDFGAMMVKDHSKANDELKAIASKKNITLPTAISQDSQKIKDDLSKKSGNNFDKDYVEIMVKDHKEDIKEFEDALGKVKDEELKSFIVRTLPTLKMHLSHIKDIEKTK